MILLLPFSSSRRPNQEAALLLKCRFQGQFELLCSPSNRRFTELRLSCPSPRVPSLFLHTLNSEVCVCVVALIRAAVRVGSASRPGRGFGEVRAISTRPLRLWRPFCSSDRRGDGAERGGGCCCCWWRRRWCVDAQPAPAARLLSPSTLRAIG